MPGTRPVSSTTIIVKKNNHNNPLAHRKGLKKVMATKSKPSFEKSISDLEKIVKALEAGDLPLEKALEKFEAGIKLSRYCSEMLDEAEKRVTLLVADEKGKIIEKQFESET